MAFFDSTQLALADGLSVIFGELYEVHFTSGTRFYWDGFGPLVAYSHTWLGSGQVVQRSEIQFGVNDDAGALTLTLSGVDDEIMNRVRNSETEFYQRPIIIWGQFFDEAIQIQGDRFQLFSGKMDVPTYGGTGPGQRSVSISCESEWADRNGSKFEFFSSRSQTKRYPGDLGLEYVYRYNAGVRRRWPQF
jgi:hypothetical protein